MFVGTGHLVGFVLCYGIRHAAHQHYCQQYFFIFILPGYNKQIPVC